MQREPGLFPRMLRWSSRSAGKSEPFRICCTLLFWTRLGLHPRFAGTWMASRNAARSRSTCRSLNRFAGCQTRWKLRFSAWSKNASRIFIAIREELLPRYACTKKITELWLKFKTVAKAYLSKNNLNSAHRAEPELGSVVCASVSGSWAELWKFDRTMRAQRGPRNCRFVSRQRRGAGNHKLHAVVHFSG